jgi:gliding motility-associated lipoprotein GldH
MNRIGISRVLFLFPAIGLLLLIISCNKIDVFEKNTVIPNYEWKSNFNVTGSFTITDTLSSYNIYLVLRHTDAYQYNNIWLNIGLQIPGDTMRYQRADIQLGTDAGGWEGSGMSDIWELRKLLNVDPMYRRFTRPGIYRFSINQIMRDDPLRNIMSAGLRIEKEKM